MAVDTAAKRSSAINPRLPWRTLPFPDAAVGAGDRQAIVWLYSGILAGAVVIPEPEPEPEPEVVLTLIDVTAPTSATLHDVVAGGSTTLHDA